MELTKKQVEGLDIAINRFLNNETYTVISGGAGVGKTTLTKFIVEALVEYNVNIAKDIVFSAFTGKACTVLQKQGHKNVCTLHKLLYDHRLRNNGTYERIPKHNIDYSIVFVDEVSMVPQEMVDLLLRKAYYVVFLGDPFQLPPVSAETANHLLDNPHIYLDEIMRQEQDSEIIQLSLKIRNNENIPYGNGKDVIVIPHNELNTGMLTWADQILVGTNGTRHDINTKMRKMLGFGEEPEDGDKIICLRNDWDTLAVNSHESLVNGSVGYLRNPANGIRTLPRFSANRRNMPIIKGSFETETGDIFNNLSMDKNLFINKEPYLTKNEFGMLARSQQTISLIPKSFDYGYAITCHKAQGDQWEKVLVIEESFPFNKEEHMRWLYTAVTRSSSKLVLVR